jgi:hypothetical protein
MNVAAQYRERRIGRSMQKDIKRRMEAHFGNCQRSISVRLGPPRYNLPSLGFEIRIQ